MFFLESLLSESFPSLGVTVHLTSLGCPQTLLISRPIVGAAQILIQSYSCVLLPAMRETWVRFLGREDRLEKEMPIHSSTLAWIIPWTEEPGRL